MHILRQFPFSPAGVNVASHNTEMAMTTDNSPGAIGGVRSLLRILALILVPDLSFAFYLFGPRAGAVAYNAAHSTVGAFALALTSQSGLSIAGFGSASVLFPIALIWFAHIGFDRALGYGLKYASGFWDTHLSAIGRARRQPA
jgi:hypothetical protein